MVPHRTKPVELPSLVICNIWTILMMEHTVVKSPSTKTPIKAIFRRLLICTFDRRGMGRVKMTQSKKMVIAARI